MKINQKFKGLKIGSIIITTKKFVENSNTKLEINKKEIPLLIGILEKSVLDLEEQLKEKQ